MSVPGTLCALATFFLISFFFTHLIPLLIETQQEGSLSDGRK